MILNLLHRFGGLPVFVTMWAPLQFDDRPLEPGSLFERSTPAEGASSGSEESTRRAGRRCSPANGWSRRCRY
jgi:hypothetical protein